MSRATTTTAVAHRISAPADPLRIARWIRRPDPMNADYDPATPAAINGESFDGAAYDRARDERYAKRDGFY